jgi:hypothetical protein
MDVSCISSMVKMSMCYYDHIWFARQYQFFLQTVPVCPDTGINNHLPVILRNEVHIGSAKENPLNFTTTDGNPGLHYLVKGPDPTIFEFSTNLISALNLHKLSVAWRKILFTQIG